MFNPNEALFPLLLAGLSQTVSLGPSCQILCGVLLILIIVNHYYLAYSTNRIMWVSPLNLKFIHIDDIVKKVVNKVMKSSSQTDFTKIDDIVKEAVKEAIESSLKPDFTKLDNIVKKAVKEAIESSPKPDFTKLDDIVKKAVKEAIESSPKPDFTN